MRWETHSHRSVGKGQLPEKGLAFAAATPDSCPPGSHGLDTAGYDKPCGVDLASRQPLPGSRGQWAKATNAPCRAQAGPTAASLYAGRGAGLGGPCALTLLRPSRTAGPPAAPVEGLPALGLGAVVTSPAECQRPWPACAVARSRSSRGTESLPPPAGLEEISKARDHSRCGRPLQAPARSSVSPLPRDDSAHLTAFLGARCSATWWGQHPKLVQPRLEEPGTLEPAASLLWALPAGSHACTPIAESLGFVRKWFN